MEENGLLSLHWTSVPIKVWRDRPYNHTVGLYVTRISRGTIDCNFTHHQLTHACSFRITGTIHNPTPYNLCADFILFLRIILQQRGYKIVPLFGCVQTPHACLCSVLADVLWATDASTRLYYNKYKYTTMWNLWPLCREENLNYPLLTTLEST